MQKIRQPAETCTSLQQCRWSLVVEYIHQNLTLIFEVNTFRRRSYYTHLWIPGHDHSVPASHSSFPLRFPFFFPGQHSRVFDNLWKVTCNINQCIFDRWCRFAPQIVRLRSDSSKRPFQTSRKHCIDLIIISKNVCPKTSLPKLLCFTRLQRIPSITKNCRCIVSIPSRSRPRHIARHSQVTLRHALGLSFKHGQKTSNVWIFICIFNLLPIWKRLSRKNLNRNLLIDITDFTSVCRKERSCSRLTHDIYARISKNIIKLAWPSLSLNFICRNISHEKPCAPQLNLTRRTRKINPPTHHLNGKDEWKIELTIASIDTLNTTLKKEIAFQLSDQCQVESETNLKHHNCQEQVTSVCWLRKKAF